MPPAPSTLDFFKGGGNVYYCLEFLLPRNNDIFWGLNSRAKSWGSEMDRRGGKCCIESRDFGKRSLGAARRAYMQFFQVFEALRVVRVGRQRGRCGIKTGGGGSVALWRCGGSDREASSPIQSITSCRHFQFKNRRWEKKERTESRRR